VIVVDGRGVASSVESFQIVFGNMCRADFACRCWLV